ncbi:hypothetical protein AC249_AIPGENE18196 [Paramuricea clavata]|uniref:Uncharacterized protein n=1 Tax=Paramuricea clavata TaxID=317549 RepID=A0A7D9L7K2_PARCT|nr:hypothetical protein AC249_AIPGENE18196 [Paramuricea clavata]
MKYNCCQQSGLCPKNQTCKPIDSQEQPWKRFSCECPEGYHGNNCDEPIMSCGGYLNGPRKSGMHKVMDSEKTVYEVYCHFESDVAWTLVQSYSFANGSLDQFKESLSADRPISENALTWSGYRLSKARMESIKSSSSFLQFTCDYEKHIDLNQSDFVQLELQHLKTTVAGNIVDVLELNGYTPNVVVRNGRGKVGEYDLRDCQIQLVQWTQWPLHVYRIYGCRFNVLFCTDNSYYNLFGSYHSHSACVKKVHRCVQNANSTTQLWFGMSKTSKASTTQPPHGDTTSGGSVEASGNP